MAFKVSGNERNQDRARGWCDWFAFLLIGMELVALTGCQAMSQHRSTQSGKTRPPMPPPRTYVVVESNSEDVLNEPETEESGLVDLNPDGKAIERLKDSEGSDVDAGDPEPSSKSDVDEDNGNDDEPD